MCKLLKPLTKNRQLSTFSITDVQKMAKRGKLCSKWGYETCGRTAEQPLNAIVRCEKRSVPAEPPTYGFVLELYYFANEIAEDLHCRPNRNIYYWIHFSRPVLHQEQ